MWVVRNRANERNGQPGCRCAHGPLWRTHAGPSFQTSRGEVDHGEATYVAAAGRHSSPPAERTAAEHERSPAPSSTSRAVEHEPDTAKDKTTELPAHPDDPDLDDAGTITWLDDAYSNRRETRGPH